MFLFLWIVCDVVYWMILRNQLTLAGCWNSSFDPDSGEDDWNYVLNRLAEHAVVPGRFITHRFSLEGLAAGAELMRDKREAYIKVMAEF